MKTIILLIVFLFPTALSGQFGETIQSGRPGQAIGANTLGKQVFQLQEGLTYHQINFDDTKTSVHTFVQSTVLRLGVLEQLELSAVINWQVDEIRNIGTTIYRGGISHTEVGARVNIAKGNRYLPTIGLQGRLLLKAQSQPYQRAKIGSNFILSTTNTLSKKVSLSTNLGMQWNGDNTKPTSFYVINMATNLNKKLSCFIEVYGMLDAFTANYDAGFAYLISKDVQFDVSAAWQGQTGVSDWFIDAGVSWRLVWR